MDWYLQVLQKYALFTGRATRKEYWMFVLVSFLIILAIEFVEPVLGTGGFIGMLYSLVILLPSVAVSIRRLHDTDRSGWWLLISLIPLIGGIVLLVFMVQDSTSGQNQYGPNPKEIAV
ncbi:MAG TPA: DUF805 domain-containing protein [Methylophilus sp.]|nr:DUF805 domain-containing protein [Methylophilus sp.]